MCGRGDCGDNRGNWGCGMHEVDVGVYGEGPGDR